MRIMLERESERERDHSVNERVRLLNKNIVEVRNDILVLFLNMAREVTLKLWK